MFIASLKYGVSNLTRFSGRDSQSQFWLYVLMTFPLLFGAIFAVLWSEISGAMERARAFAEANPDKATITTGPGTYRITINDPSYEMGVDGTFLLGGMLAIGLLAIVLYAAAVCRRLHDRNYRGWWGAIPAVLFVIASVSMTNSINKAMDDIDPVNFMIVWLIAMTYNVSLVVLLIQCAMPGKHEANRFGEVPRKAGDHSPE